MPKAKVKKRGGSKRVRTKTLPSGKFIHVHVVRKKGPRGGTTVTGPVHRRKSRSKKSRKRARKRTR